MSTMDYCAISAAAPPKGRTSNLLDPKDLSIETLAVGSVFAGLSIFFLSGRLFVNRKRLAMADYLAIIGFIFSTGYSGVIMNMHSYSRHIWDVPVCWFMQERLSKLLFVSNIMLGITQFTTKLPIMVLYLQMFSVERKMKLFIKLAIAFSALVYIPHLILVIVFQAPRAGESWSDPGTNGRTRKMTYYAPIHGVCEVILNIWMLIIPLLVIRNLQITRRKKIQLSTVFLTGIM
ncbi:hypothetical protein KVR01_013852 [Diaporthe batatas]|uniref:uncharacterized protein n=1 Tax=Diaporthe batatas TaxID=748121 RepID=UPI001D047B75|nr:uncharacterized protein KVR01_013852 [Diaporthe batatas]KAG8156273.1 hypothetical protein KVR01_013852 [Diaporthe batatas]